MNLALSERRAVTKQTALRYQQAPKKQKSIILTEFCATTGYHRSYARFILRNWGRKVKLTMNGVRTIYQIGGPRKKQMRHHSSRVYGQSVTRTLKLLWAISDGICGKRLVPFIREVLPILERFEEITLDSDTRRKLLRISPATVDRLLAPLRAASRRKGHATTKPGTLLKHRIPIRTFSQWDERSPGFVEIDLVSHEGGIFYGDNIYSLDLTDVCTKWTETRAVPNRAQRWVFNALKDIIDILPFPIRGIDSDNGSEFINNHLVRYCDEHKLNFTRSRPYRKNDNCFVEQKNYSIVRRTVGYLRYDTPDELDLLNQIYHLLRLFTNFFQPAMNLIEKTRIGSKVIKKYDTPATPYHRVLTHPGVSKEHKNQLRQQYQKLNPADLKRSIASLQERLFDIASKKERPRRHYQNLKLQGNNETNLVYSR